LSKTKPYHFSSVQFSYVALFAPLHVTYFIRMKENKKPWCRYREGRPTVPPLPEGQHPTFGPKEKAIAQRWLQSHTRYGDAAISNATINAKIRYGVRRTWVMAARRNFTFNIAVKLLQIETWLLLTAYEYSLSPYPTVLSPTPYDVPFSHNTCVTERRQTDRQT